MLGSGPSFEHDYEHVLERIDGAFEAGRKTLHAAGGLSQDLPGLEGPVNPTGLLSVPWGRGWATT